MKKILSIFILATIICFSSCDRIKSPIIKKNTVTGSSFVTKNNFAVYNYKKALLEDYTGMRCPNCPEGTIIAENLLATYGNSLVVVAVHAGGLSNPFGNYTADYRTEAGDKWNGSTGYGIVSYPTGLINRKAYSPNDVKLDRTAWTSVMTTAMADPFIVKLKVTTNYDTIVGALNTDVTAIFNTAYAQNLNISVLVTEDGIVGKQDDKGVEIEEYEFEHMMRGALNSPWGEALTTSAKAANDSVKYSLPNFNLKGMAYVIDKPDPTPDVVKPIVVNDKKISVIVFVYNATTREILQVEKVKIR
ncbi:MAG: Omp28-related outer membrane protein [Bacteroidota bacterium]|nr:Omp28-related outer membrane protein [Bacteroidota bacterium]